MWYLEDYWVGKTIESVDRYIVTEEEIMEVGRRWDPRPFHTDREAAAKSYFGSLVACSAHLFAIVSWCCAVLNRKVQTPNLFPNFALEIGRVQDLPLRGDFIKTACCIWGRRNERRTSVHRNVNNPG
jgi:acyl dehydratase